MTGSPPKVFISYSHDTVGHQERVLGLADRLRADGIDAEIDQYNASPPEGWPLWCERQIEDADFVLMVCTETYHRRVKGDEQPGQGRGVVWESRIIRQRLYDAGAVSDKFVPVLFPDSSPEHIPTLIRGSTWYVLDTDESYEALYRRLTEQPGVFRSPLGPLGSLPTRPRKWLAQPALSANSLPSNDRTVIANSDRGVAIGGDAVGSTIVTGITTPFKHSIGSPKAPDMPFNAIRAALQALVEGSADEADRRLIGDALRAGGIELAEGDRAVALGGSADGATIVTGDGSIVLSLDTGGARAVRALSGPPMPRQLPSDLADFTGREKEIEKLEKALCSNGGRAAIGGMGGLGKTALAVHVAHLIKSRYADGQIVVHLRGTTTEPLSPGAAMGRVIASLDPTHKLRDDACELAGLYRSLLAGKQLLILFDDAADAAQVRELLPTPPCAAIVTSRRAVVLPGVERVPLDVLALEETDALLRGILGEERASAEERAKLAERCGNLPLALRVAATFLEQYPDWRVPEYLAALADERDRLRQLRLEGDPLLDVAATLGLSLRQLARERPELAVRWRLLSVFAGGFDREAAAATWAVTASEAREGLSLLLERSMLLFGRTRARYRMHDLMRDVALGATDQLTTENHVLLEEARDRHAAHYRRLLAEVNTLLLQGGEDAAAGLARFDQERANVEAAWRWLAVHAADNPGISLRCSDYVEAGYEILLVRQHPRQRRQWLEEALAAARRSGDQKAEANHLGNLGYACWSLGEPHCTIEYYEQCLAIARKSGNRRGIGYAFGMLGHAYWSVGEPHRAIEYYEQALAIARAIGNRRGESHALVGLGRIYRDFGEPRRAIEHIEQALAIGRETGNRRREGYALEGLGVTYLSLGEPRRAIEHLEQSLTIARETIDRSGEGYALGGLGSEPVNLLVLAQ